MATTQADGTSFIVHLEGIKLPPEGQALLAREVRAAALRELARLDLAVDFGVRVPRKEWLGLWLEHIKELPRLAPPGAPNVR